MFNAKNNTDTVVPANAGTQRLTLAVPESPEEPGVGLRRDDAQGAIDWRKLFFIRAATASKFTQRTNALPRLRG